MSFLLILQVYHKEQGFCFRYYCMTKKHQEAYHTVNHVFSLSKSYVYLEPVAGTLPCGQIQTIQVHSSLNGHVLALLKEVVLYYLVSTDSELRNRKKLPRRPNIMNSPLILNHTSFDTLTEYHHLSLNDEYINGGMNLMVSIVMNWENTFYFKIVAKGSIIWAGTHVLPIRPGERECSQFINPSLTLLPTHFPMDPHNWAK